MADEQTNIRLPVELKRRLENEAREGRRTFTSEVVGRLQSSFAGSAGAWLPPDLYRRVADAATESSRSLAAEMIFRLEQSFNMELTVAKRAELIRVVNEAIDERFEHELRKLTPPPAKKGK